ncbi:hypothetical protein [Rhizobacter sp. Root1221]|uniref:hypothetical protein n=1 Tax=Rhizobacter sp. Root1221 TaxID=1736433 RepID=UPI0006FF147E|nr:hypothetical protein [Rhizobacter sp. Root1221]KQV99347.1 hypothetical protein ASC87_21435 [Rhizobacter sp. Root1221]
MIDNLKRYLVVLAACAVVSVAIVLFNGRSLPALINLGSYVGAAFMLLGAGRLLNGGNAAIHEANTIQRSQNREAEYLGRPLLHTQIVPMFLSSGTLFFAGLTWLVALQAVRYTWAIVL